MALDPKYKAVVFDMDGTFMNTKVNYTKLSNVVFDEMRSIGVPENVIDRSNGSRSELSSGMEWMKANGMTEEINSIGKRISKRATDVELENAHLAQPFEGSLEVLDLLKKKGYKTGILTRGGRRYAECVLNLFDILNDFDVIVARDDYPDNESKPSPIAMQHVANAIGVRPDEILYLGDHVFDWMTARDSGAGFYGVLSGNYDINNWKAINDDVQLLDSVKNLLYMI
ncbi:MAG: HAD family hydrolase [Candidatus Methanogranum gryphiswaldense]|nr:MAG: HAD family hydrolase [Candidatus Methanogranum sp. U3.2.1]